MHRAALFVVIAACSYTPGVGAGDAGQGSGPGDGGGSASSDGSGDGGSSGGPLAIDATSNGKGTSAATLFWPHTVSGNNRLLVVGVSWGVGTLVGVTSVTYGTSALSSLGSITNTTKNIHVAMYAEVAPPLGTHPVTITFAGPVPEVVGGAVSFTGADQMMPTGPFHSLAGPDNPTPSLMVPSAPMDIVVDTIVVDTNPNGIAPSPGQTAAWDVSESEWAGGSTRPGAPMVTMGWQVSGSLDDWAIAAVSVHGG